MLVIHSMDEVVELIKARLSLKLGVSPEDVQGQFGFINGEAAVVVGINEEINDDLFEEEDSGQQQTSDDLPTDKVEGETKPVKRRKRHTRAEIEADEAKQAAEAAKSPEASEPAKAEGENSQQAEAKPESKAPVLEAQPEASADPTETDKAPFEVDEPAAEENLFADPADNAGAVVDAGSPAAEPTAAAQGSVEENLFADDAEPTPTVAAQNPFADGESTDLFAETEEVKPTTEVSGNGFSKPAGTGDEVLDLFA